MRVVRRRKSETPTTPGELVSAAAAQIEEELGADTGIDTALVPFGFQNMRCDLIGVDAKGKSTVYASMPVRNVASTGAGLTFTVNFELRLS